MITDPTLAARQFPIRAITPQPGRASVIRPRRSLASMIRPMAFRSAGGPRALAYAIVDNCDMVTALNLLPPAFYRLDNVGKLALEDAADHLSNHSHAVPACACAGHCGTR